MVQCYRKNTNCLQLFNATETTEIVYNCSMLQRHHTLYTGGQLYQNNTQFTGVQFYTETTITCKYTTDVGCAAKYYRLDTCLHWK